MSVELLLKYSVSVNNNKLVSPHFKDCEGVELDDELLGLWNNDQIPAEDKLRLIITRVYNNGEFNDEIKKGLIDVIQNSGLYDIVYICPECELPYKCFMDACNEAINYYYHINKDQEIKEESESLGEELVYSKCLCCDSEFENYGSVDLLYAIDKTSKTYIPLGSEDYKYNEYSILAGVEVLNFLNEFVTYEKTDRMVYKCMDLIHQVCDEETLEEFRKNYREKVLIKCGFKQEKI
jgi:hypothetical protein